MCVCVCLSFCFTWAHRWPHSDSVSTHPGVCEQLKGRVSAFGLNLLMLDLRVEWELRNRVWKKKKKKINQWWCSWKISRFGHGLSFNMMHICLCLFALHPSVPAFCQISGVLCLAALRVRYHFLFKLKRLSPQDGSDKTIFQQRCCGGQRGHTVAQQPNCCCQVSESESSYTFKWGSVEALWTMNSLHVVDMVLNYFILAK